MKLINFVRRIIFPIIIVFVVISSIILDTTINPWLLAMFGLLFLASVIWDKRIPYALVIQALTLVCFHACSQLNWSAMLYYILVVLTVVQRPKHAVAIAVSLSLLYTATRLSYMPNTSYNLLVSIYDLISFQIIVILLRLVITSEQDKKKLRLRNEYLAAHDPLTGLLNYDGYLGALKRMSAQPDASFTLLLLDLQGFRSVELLRYENEILAKFAHSLQYHFPQASAISRYAGDRFALLFPRKPNTIKQIQQVLASNQLDFEVTYSIAEFPLEAAEAQAIITLAENRLFENKRLQWLKQEEEMFSSEKLKIVGELAAGMAHEIRNPLTTLRGFIDLSRSHAFNIERWIDIIMHEITRMSELTSEFLQFSKPHISNMRNERLADCIERVHYLTESLALSKGHLLTVEHEDADGTLVFMDRDKMVQVLLNLVRNAIEAMQEPGKVIIRSRIVGTQIAIDIQDTGCGISEDGLTKIFNPFYTTKETGTGLGLSICQKIVQDHSGDLTATSVIGAGSVFTITLPLASGTFTGES